MFYVYAHLDPVNKRPFYVGKGNGIRANSRTGRSAEWNKIVEDLLKVGLTFEVKILHVCNDSDEALKIEKAEIKALLSKGYSLINKHVNTTEDNENDLNESRVKAEARRLKKNIAEAVDESLDKKLVEIYKRVKIDVSDQLLEKIKSMGIDVLFKKTKGVAGRATAEESEERLILFFKEIVQILQKNGNVPIRRRSLIDQSRESASFSYLALEKMVDRGILKEEKFERQQMLYSLIDPNIEISAKELKEIKPIESIEKIFHRGRNDTTTLSQIIEICLKTVGKPVSRDVLVKLTGCRRQVVMLEFIKMVEEGKILKEGRGTCGHPYLYSLANTPI